MTDMIFCMEELKKEYDESSFFTSDKDCIEYLLGVNLQPLEEYSLLIIRREAWVITPHALDCQDVQQILYEGYSNTRYQDKLRNIMKRLDEFSLPAKLHAAFEKLCYAEYFRSRQINVRDVTAEVRKACLIKNEEQIERIRQCVAINEKAYRALFERNIYGETELSVFRYVEEAIMEHTSYANRMIYDFLAGNRTGEVSGFPANYAISRQDTLIADLLPRHRGVYADMTRTYFAGAPGYKQEYHYEILREALQEGEELLKPGIMAKEVYEAVYKVFKKYGVEQHFPHHAGHGLGMGYYEAPFFLSGETDILQENMVVAIEPGLYFEKEFGMRIENNYLITNNGARRLGNLPVNIEEFIMPYGK